MSDYDSDNDEEVMEIGFHSSSTANNQQLWRTSSTSDRPSFPSFQLEGSSPQHHTDPGIGRPSSLTSRMEAMNFGSSGNDNAGGGIVPIGGRNLRPDGPNIVVPFGRQMSAPSSSQSRNREIAIYWDLTSCPLPGGISAEEASSALCGTASSRLSGTVVERRLYVDPHARNQALNAAGFHIVDDFQQQPPSNARTRQRKLIVDVLCFAWDRVSKRLQQQLLQQDQVDELWIVLVANDVTYSYLLTKLRERGVRSLLICSGEDDTQFLQVAADSVMQFGRDILGLVDPQRSEHNPSTSITTEESKPATYASRVAAQQEHLPHPPRPDSEWTTVTSSKPMEPTQVQILCKVLADGSTETVDTDDWVLGSKLGVLFRAAVSSKSSTASGDIKESYKNARDTAIQKDLVERGFKYQGYGAKKNQIVPEKTNEKWKEQGKLSKEDFFRLTKDGREVLKSAAVAALSKTDNKRTNVFIKNIPREMPIMAFVDTLERDYNVDVVRAYYLPSTNTEVAYTFACLQVMTSQDTDKLLEASRKALLIAGGRVLACKINDGPYNSSAIDPKDEYRRSAGRQRQSSTNAPPTNEETPLDQETNPALAYCRAVDAFLRQRTENNVANLPDGWCDAGFWVQLKVGLLGGDKDRVKNARTLAISKGWIEAGRRLVGTEGASIQIEAVDGTRNPSRHALELYVRVTDVGRRQLGTASTRFAPAATGEDAVSDPNSKLEDRLLFVKSLPLNTSVTVLVQFLESEFSLSVNKAWVEEPKASAAFTNAHFEMQSTKDARRMMHLSSRAGEGIFFQGRALEVVRDQRIPSFRYGDPRCYFRDGDSQNESTAKTDDPRSSADIATVFCRVLRQKALTKGNDRTWINSGSVGEGFMRHFRNVSPDQRKEMFARARQSVISNGLVDFGRRLLASTSQEVTVAAFMGKYDSTVLSSESYLRLTAKGASVVMSSSRVLSGTPMVPAKSSAPKNGYFLNLPETARMKDFVEYIEMTHGVKVRYGVMRRTPGFVSAQVEFMTHEDYNVVNESLTVQDGIDYEGSKVRMREDKGVPDWEQAVKDDGTIFYEMEPEDEDLPPELHEEVDEEIVTLPTDTISIPMQQAPKPTSSLPGDSLLSPDSAHRFISMLSFDMPEDNASDTVQSRAVGGTAPAAPDVFRQFGGETPQLYGSTLGSGSEPARPLSNPSDTDLFHMQWDAQSRSFRRVPISREALDKQISQNAAMMRGPTGDSSYLSSTPSPVPVQFRRVPDFEDTLNPVVGTGPPTGFSDLPTNQGDSIFPTQQSFNIHQPRPVFPPSQPGVVSRPPGSIPGSMPGSMPGPLPIGESHRAIGSGVTAAPLPQRMQQMGDVPPGMFGAPRGPPGMFGIPQGPPGIVPPAGFGGPTGISGLTPPPASTSSYAAGHMDEPREHQRPRSSSSLSHPSQSYSQHRSTETGQMESPDSKRWSDILKK